MPAMPSDTPACPDTADRQHRLAALLADMIPGAATIRVSLNDPKQEWPHPHTVVKDEGGETMELGRTTARVAARWILRVWPDADWNRPHTFDLADATLTPRDNLTAAGRGR
ncbi:transcriptional regulator [Streptomyces sp. SID13666]|uniref:transcriptional regulator n=1 Tax=unclassified Streptomyces TaxID=2593676 RepID=UPI0013C1D279|nr:MULTISPECIES: transcriptional regulator [unclassified Streptomyces]NEA56617.1 transcriptional regulator [Streptomyces sp. SID13666]NEA73061.1 transcriptional regulator [Streptomyces sp. SID13588]